MKKLARIMLVVPLLFACVGCDQATKVVATTHLGDGPTLSFLHDTIRLTYAENPGAFLGFGASLSHPARTLLLQIGVSILTLGLVLSAALWPRLSRLQIFALTLLGASGLGNLIDRFLHDGRVTDFLNVGIGSLRTGIFNVADMYGMVGVALLLVYRSTPSAKVSALPSG